MAEYDVLKLGVFRHTTTDAQPCKNLYHVCDNRQRKRLTSFSWSVVISVAVSQGWCVAAISSVCVYVCLSGTTTPRFLRRCGAPVTPTNSRQAGWETDLSSCFRKAKINHGDRIFEAVGGINVGDYMYLRGRQERWGRKLLLDSDRRAVEIEAYWYCGLGNVAPSPLDSRTWHPSVDLPWSVDEINPKALSFQKFHLPCQMMSRW